MTPDRDQSVEHILRGSLSGRRDTASEASCLDAETLAAWVDRGLSASEMALAEAHLAGCPRCQAMLGTIARSTPPAAQPKPWWQRGWSLRWLVPLAAGAAAVALWIAVPRQSPPAVESQTAAVDSSKPASPIDRIQTPQSPVSEIAPKAASAAPPVRAEEAVEKKAQKPAGLDEVNRLNQLADSRVPAAAPVRPPESAARSDQAALGLRETVSGMPIASPDPKILWRIGGVGVVQLSTDGGTSWEDLSTGVATELTAGVAPSPSVCWIVGRQGTVLRTTDGRRWQRVPFPEVVDLTAIQAIDAGTASVTTADGRVFRTADGGNTWNLASLQEF